MGLLTRLALILGLAVVLAMPVAAQQRQRGQGQGGGGFGAGGGGFTFLLRNESVQKELKLEKEQTDKVTETVKKVQDKYTDEFTKLRDLAQEERRTKSEELNKKVNDEILAGISEILKAEQTKRLKQIEVQRATLNAFTRVEVQKTLEINDEQKVKIKTITDETNTKVRELMGAGGNGGRGQRGGAGGAGGRAGGGAFGANIEKVTALRKEAMEKVLAVFTEAQKKSWKEMTGETFTVAVRPPMKKDD